MSPDITPIDTSAENNDHDMSPSQSGAVPPSLTQPNPSSPIRFATTTNAFGLAAPPASTYSPPSTREAFHFSGVGSDSISPTAGDVGTRRIRGISMLSLAQTASLSSRSGPNSEEIMVTGPGQPPEDIRNSSSSQNRFALQPTPRRRSAALTIHEALRRTTSAPPPLMEGVSGSTTPIPQMETMEADGSGSQSPLEVDGNRPPSRGRRGRARINDRNTSPHSNPLRLHMLTGKPLPAPLLATLLSESSPQEHEMRSEARLQRLLSSHPQALPLTPRAPRSSRGRFPEMVGGDDDEDENLILRRSSWARTSWMMNRADSSDSDLEDLPMEDPPETVNAAFAAGMDMDRPTSSSSSCVGVDSGKSTPGHGMKDSVIHAQPTPPLQSAPWTKNLRMSFGSAGAGMVPSPGSGLFLPTAFGGLGMGGVGTPSGSPTVERLELAGSPSAISVSSPGLMHYRESQGGSASSVRPGKRKAQGEERFDPYKRPRASSPSYLTSPAFPMSPSRPSAIPIPQSPGHAPLYPSALSTSGPASIPTRHTKAHPYTRPMSSRSRAASPSLSISSTSGLLSTTGTRTGFSLGQAFSPALVSQPLGGLGLLSLSAEERKDDSADRARESSGDSKEAMEED